MSIENKKKNSDYADQKKQIDQMNKIIQKNREERNKGKVTADSQINEDQISYIKTDSKINTQKSLIKIEPVQNEAVSDSNTAGTGSVQIDSEGSKSKKTAIPGMKNTYTPQSSGKSIYAPPLIKDQVQPKSMENIQNKQAKEAVRGEIKKEQAGAYIKTYNVNSYSADSSVSQDDLLNIQFKINQILNNYPGSRGIIKGAEKQIKVYLEFPKGTNDMIVSEAKNKIIELLKQYSVNNEIVVNYR